MCLRFLFWFALLSLLFASAADTQELIELRWPMDSPQITQDYSCKDCYRTGSHHLGIDIYSSDPTVRAAASGVVHRTFRGCMNGDFSCGDVYGNHVVVRHGSIFALYAHLDSVENGILSGVSVGVGQPLGIMGRTGAADGVHLHFQLMAFDPGFPGDNPTHSGDLGMDNGYTGRHPSLGNEVGQVFPDPKIFFASTWS